MNALTPGRHADFERSQMPPEPYASSALFHGLQKSTIRTLLDEAQIENYPPRTWLYRQGEPACHLFLVESGLVRLSQLTPDGDDLLVRFVKQGEVFGYFALAQDGPNVISAQTIQASRIASWECAVAQRLFRAIPAAATNLFTIAVRDVLYFYDRTRRLLTQDVGRRVEWALAELVRTMGVPSAARVVVTDGIAQKDLAELAGTTIFTVSRELTRLAQQGIVEKQRGRIVVLKPNKLTDW